MKKLLLVALLTPMVAIPSARQKAQQERERQLAAAASGSSATRVAPSAPTAPAPSAPTMVQLAQDLASDSGRLANLLAAFEAANNLPGGNAVDGRADLATLNSL